MAKASIAQESYTSGPETYCCKGLDDTIAVCPIAWVASGVHK